MGVCCTSRTWTWWWRRTIISTSGSRLINALFQRDPVRGVRHFVAGTGGAELYPTAFVHVASELRISAFGVLKLTLNPGSYDWEFLRVDGARGDSGSGPCH